ncbi:DUF3253 domain-containing protein [Mucilaginibacter conchicola]|uniref:DUF3253 domain-containing protein n=1 Tax=Mucilaginibacter conchicola TaxID=2303333 RepID=A0A372NYX5_9SPHI|nr:DUF3253 domain-containing protein [Mucilaginibacter conchicola]RFZ95232.1 DUF3253 domain-containing protein [Mucilaginibacter conchicola]
MPTNSIKQTILTMAAQRAPYKTVCPSEIACAMFPEDWRKHMDEVRVAAIELQKAGEVTITQKGKPVDVDRIKGPVRIKFISRRSQ